MKAVIQKVKNATLYSNNEKYSEISSGMLILFGVSVEDDVSRVKKFAEKISKLRIFDDENGKINKSISDICGQVMVVSNFTLYGSLKGTNRPDFIMSAKPDKAEEIYNLFIKELSVLCNVKHGVFRTYMEIQTVLDGPGTYVIEG